MNITLFRGARGKSKTCTLIKEGLKFQKVGWIVLTNMKNTPFEQITAKFILSLSGDSMLKNTVLLIDEIELYFDATEWSRGEAKNFGRFLQQIRKRNVKILCTAQYTNLIYNRLRQQIDVVVLCDFKYPYSSSLYIDLTSFETDQRNPLCGRVTYNALPIFGLYDTNELIE